MKKYKVCTFIIIVTVISVFCVNTLNAAVITFDDAVSGATSYSFDGDGDAVDDVIFTTTDTSGFNTAGPGSNMTYINEPGLEGTSLLSQDLRVDFPVGAAGTLGFGYALNSSTEDGTASFNVYDASDTLLVTTTDTGLYTYPAGQSNFPEGYISVSFAGLASYATFGFTSDYGRFIIDNFEGTYGSTEDSASRVIPAPGALLLGSMGMGIVGWLRRRRNL